MLDRLLRVPEVLELVGGITYTTLWSWCREGKFPAPVVLNPNCKRRHIAWRTSEVEAWIESRPRGKGARVPQPHLEVRRAAKITAAANSNPPTADPRPDTRPKLLPPHLRGKQQPAA